MSDSLPEIPSHQSLLKGQVEVEVAMGLAVWTFVLLGAIAGHLVTVLNYVVFSGWLRSQEEVIDDIVARAVQTAVRECVVDSPKPESIDPYPKPFDWNQSSWILDINIKVFFVWFAGLAFGGLVFGFTLCWCPIASFGRAGEPQPSSPSGSPLRLEDIARNQLAELRLRRHEPSRAIRSS